MNSLDYQSVYPMAWHGVAFKLSLVAVYHTRYRHPDLGILNQLHIHVS